MLHSAIVARSLGVPGGRVRHRSWRDLRRHGPRPRRGGRRPLGRSGARRAGGGAGVLAPELAPAPRARPTARPAGRDARRPPGSRSSATLHRRPASKPGWPPGLPASAFCARRASHSSRRRRGPPSSSIVRALEPLLSRLSRPRCDGTLSRLRWRQDAALPRPNSGTWPGPDARSSRTRSRAQLCAIVSCGRGDTPPDPSCRLSSRRNRFAPCVPCSVTRLVRSKVELGAMIETPEGVRRRDGRLRSRPGSSRSANRSRFEHARAPPRLAARLGGDSGRSGRCSRTSRPVAAAHEVGNHGRGLWRAAGVPELRCSSSASASTSSASHRRASSRARCRPGTLHRKLGRARAHDALAASFCRPGAWSPFAVR